MVQAQDLHQENASKGHMLKNGLRLRVDLTVQAQAQEQNQTMANLQGKEKNGKEDPKLHHQGKEKNGKEDPKLLLLQGKDVMRDGTLKKREEEKNG